MVRLLKKKQKGRQPPSRLINNGKIISSEHDIASEFNQHFVNVGPKLANSIAGNETPTRYISISPVSSFVMSPVFVTGPVTNAQVLNHFLTLDKNKASLDIPNAMLRMIAPIISPVLQIFMSRLILALFQTF